MLLFAEVDDEKNVLGKLQFNILSSLPEQYALPHKIGDWLGPELLNESARVTAKWRYYDTENQISISTSCIYINYNIGLSLQAI